MYLVSDVYGDFKDIMNYKQLRELYIVELKDDILENRQDYDILKSGLDEFEILVQKDYYNPKHIADSLEGYGCYVQDLSTLQRDLNNLREYLHGHTKFNSSKNEDIKQSLLIGAMDNVLDYLDKVGR